MLDEIYHNIGEGESKNPGCEKTPDLDPIERHAKDLAGIEGLTKTGCIHHMWAIFKVKSPLSILLFEFNIEPSSFDHAMRELENQHG